MEKLGKLESGQTATGVSQTLTYIKIKTSVAQCSSSSERALREGHAQGKSLLESPPEQLQL